MARSYVQVAPDSTGKKVDAFEYTIAGLLVEAQAIVRVDSSGSEVVESAQRTPAITVATASGSVAAGTRKMTMIFSSDFTGTVLGASISGVNDRSLTIDAPARDTLAAIAYTITAGNIRIITVS